MGRAGGKLKDRGGAPAEGRGTIFFRPEKGAAVINVDFATGMLVFSPEQNALFKAELDVEADTDIGRSKTNVIEDTLEEEIFEEIEEEDPSSTHRTFYIDIDNREVEVNVYISELEHLSGDSEEIIGYLREQPGPVANETLLDLIQQKIKRQETLSPDDLLDLEAKERGFSLGDYSPAFRRALRGLEGPLLEAGLDFLSTTIPSFNRHAAVFQQIELSDRQYKNSGEAEHAEAAEERVLELFRDRLPLLERSENISQAIARSIPQEDAGLPEGSDISDLPQDIQKDIRLQGRAVADATSDNWGKFRNVPVEDVAGSAYDKYQRGKKRSLRGPFWKDLSESDRRLWIQRIQLGVALSEYVTLNEQGEVSRL